MAIVIAFATCCAGYNDSAGAGGKESASATTWRLMQIGLAQVIALLVVRF
ncbi:hypothetical protein [Escherichia sp. E1130]|nr:hypothetical protein [Escherichia sp. E1130]